MEDSIYLQYLHEMPDVIQNKINSFRFLQDAQRSLLGNLLLVEGLKNIELKNISLNDIAYTTYNRPYLPSVNFNISHSGEYVVCAISKQDIVGIDVEEIIDIPVDGFENLFSVTEITEILEDKSLQYFYRLWTQKEAFLKAIGKGLSVPLNQVFVEENSIYWEGKVWFLHRLELDVNYAAHLCVGSTQPDIILKEVGFK